MHLLLGIFFMILHTVTGLNRECGYLYTKTYSDTDIYFSDAIRRYRYHSLHLKIHFRFIVHFHVPYCCFCQSVCFLSLFFTITIVYAPASNVDTAECI